MSSNSEGNVSREEILPLMGPVVKKGPWIMGYCPSHNDGQAHNHKGGQSLGLSEAGVLRCFAGCDFGMVYQALLTRAGAERIPSQTARRAQGGEKSVATYSYATHDGIALFKSRFETPDKESEKGYTKRFAWRREGGDYQQGIRPIRMEDISLFGTNEIEIDETGGDVFFVEGEKAVQAIQAQGWLAVCAPGGASQKNFGDSLDVLKGRRVVLWPDNDPAGRDHMKYLERQLRTITEIVGTVNPPVPPKGDAVDYFHAGGAMEAIREGFAITSPVVEWLGEDKVRIKIPMDLGIAVFTFEDMVKNYRAWDTELTVHTDMAGVKTEPYWSRINLLSSSAIAGLVTALNAQFGKEANWRPVVSKAVNLLREAANTLDEVSELESPEGDEKPAWLIPNLVLENGGTVIFGAPGKGKSTTAMAVAIALDAGVPIGPFSPTCARRVLYVNLERPERAMGALKRRINTIAGLDPARGLLWLQKQGHPLDEIINQIRKAVVKHDLGLVIVDSISRTGGGDLNENATANRMTDLMASIGCAWMAIGHSPRGDDTHVYGSIHWQAGCDVEAGIQSGDADQGNELGIRLVVTKSNHGKKGQQWVYAIDYDDWGVANIRTADTSEFGELHQRTVEGYSPVRRIEEVMKAVKKPMTVEEIGEEADMNHNTVRKILSQHRDKFVTIDSKMVPSDKGERLHTLWGLLAPVDDGPKSTDHERITNGGGGGAQREPQSSLPEGDTRIIRDPGNISRDQITDHESFSAPLDSDVVDKEGEKGSKEAPEGPDARDPVRDPDHDGSRTDHERITNQTVTPKDLIICANCKRDNSIPQGVNSDGEFLCIACFDDVK